MIAPHAPAVTLAAPILVVIPGDPVAQGRGRAFVHNRTGRVTVCDPKRSTSWKGAAQVHMLAARQAAGVYAPLDVALVVTVDAYWTRPKSMPKRADPGRLPRLSKPDADNVGKCVLDAGCGVIFVDDRLVVRLVVNKWIAAAGDGPRVEIRVEEWASCADGTALASVKCALGGVS